jgi:hypothetical protein
LPGGYRFSNIAGTIFENTNVNLREWFRVIHLMLTSKKGISARQVHRCMGFGGIDTLTSGLEEALALRPPFMRPQLSHRSKNFALRSETVDVSDG